MEYENENSTTAVVEKNLVISRDETENAGADNSGCLKVEKVENLNQTLSIDCKTITTTEEQSNSTDIAQCNVQIHTEVPVDVLVVPEKENIDGKSTMEDPTTAIIGNTSNLINVDTKNIAPAEGGPMSSKVPDVASVNDYKQGSVESANSAVTGMETSQTEEPIISTIESSNLNNMETQNIASAEGGPMSRKEPDVTTVNDSKQVNIESPNAAVTEMESSPTEEPIISTIESSNLVNMETQNTAPAEGGPMSSKVPDVASVNDYKQGSVESVNSAVTGMESSPTEEPIISTIESSNLVNMETQNIASAEVESISRKEPDVTTVNDSKQANIESPNAAVTEMESTPTEEPIINTTDNSSNLINIDAENSAPAEVESISGKKFDITSIDNGSKQAKKDLENAADDNTLNENICSKTAELMESMDMDNSNTQARSTKRKPAKVDNEKAKESKTTTGLGLLAQYNSDSDADCEGGGGEVADDGEVVEISTEVNKEYRTKVVEIDSDSDSDGTSSDESAVEYLSTIRKEIQKSIDLEDDDEDDDDDDDADGDGDADGAKKKKKKKSTMRVKGEMLLEDLPPIQDLHITVPEDECIQLGNVHSVVDQLLLVSVLPGSLLLDLDTVLFLDKGKKVLGAVFDVLGQVADPLYCIRFNSHKEIEDKGIKVGDTVYVAPKTEYTQFVILSSMMKLRGSDASWEHDIEPPPKYLDYSDDEEEREARRTSLRNKDRPTDNEEPVKRARHSAIEANSPSSSTSSSNAQHRNSRGRFNQNRNGPMVSRPPYPYQRNQVSPSSAYHTGSWHSNYRQPFPTYSNVPYGPPMPAPYQIGRPPGQYPLPPGQYPAPPGQYPSPGQYPPPGQYPSPHMSPISSPTPPPPPMYVLNPMAIPPPNMLRNRPAFTASQMPKPIKSESPPPVPPGAE